ncbi:hypothetical protein B0H14DRAFT_2798188 [Mycena olivaceomarginata]|nr:hypothetical protein B0H14DRAFT_2798188 [Mycena olivaceomarginata]
MGFGDSPKSPSFTKDRRGWNSAWEHDLATLYGSEVEISYLGGRPVPDLTAGLPTEYYDMMLGDAHVLNLQTITKQICILQRDLTRKSSERFAEDDFESHWMNRSTAKEREDFILEGFVRACLASPGFEEQRKWCPELTLKRLNHGSGEGFLDLLKNLMFPDLDKVPNDFRTVPNAVYDKIHAFGDASSHPGCALAKKASESRRTYLLTMVVWNILLAFYNESEEYNLGKGVRKDPEELKRIKQLFGNIVDTRDISRETAASRLLGERQCTSCGLPAAKAGVAALAACQRCKAIDRLVLYCSKKCQAADWKGGHPPHKTICGKEGAIVQSLLTTASEATVDEDDIFPPPKPGYTRSPALLYQLKRLRENPEVDYLLIEPEPLPDHGVVVPDALGRVLMMFQQLEPTTRWVPGFGVARLKKQLLKESMGYRSVWPTVTVGK